jgi:hypothetical protein
MADLSIRWCGHDETAMRCNAWRDQCGGRRMLIKTSLAERGHDLYETPREATEALLRAEKLPRNIWEPACGPGAIVRVLRAHGHTVLATDLIDYQSKDQDHAHRDFLMEARLPPGIEMLCSNVPFKLASQFAAHALSLCPRVALLLRLSFLESGTEKSAAGRARLQVLDSGHLARVHVFRNRLPMMHRDGWTGNRVSNPTPYAWFIWDRDYRGPATLSRISWTPDARTPPARGAHCGRAMETTK